jgi:hypothetical protein
LASEGERPTSANEGASLTALHKRKYSSAGDTFASVSVTANSGQDGVLPADSSTRTNEQSQSVDELTMPTLINLQESGLHRSSCIRKLREKEAQQNKSNEVHVRFGENVKKTTLALFNSIFICQPYFYAKAPSQSQHDLYRGVHDSTRRDQ